MIGKETDTGRSIVAADDSNRCLAVVVGVDSNGSKGSGLAVQAGSHDWRL
jgi:hypothetical protein